MKPKPAFSLNGEQRLDIVELSQYLDKALKDQNLDPDGLNPQRNELYKECFEQLIFTLDDDGDNDNSFHLATLLSRLKDELTMTSDSYKQLYESSVTFGIRKALAARHENEDLRSKNKALHDDNVSLKEQNDYLLRKVSVLEQKSLCQKGDRKQLAKYKQEIRRMKGRNEVIKQHVEECLVQGHNEVYNAMQTDTNQ
jgi:dynein light intermediate chain